MSTYYNEIDPFADAWLENLIGAGLISRGVVDGRSILEVDPYEIRSYSRAHFFAGIGCWDYALQLAGWPDDLTVWTGSCPCQPFSVAGSGNGVTDERHLWPAWFERIRAARPPVIFGEQVASPAALEWFDAVSADLELAGYSVGATDLCAAGVGAPHIRQRLYFVGISNAVIARRDRPGLYLCGGSPSQSRLETAGGGATRRMAHGAGEGLEGRCIGTETVGSSLFDTGAHCLVNGVGDSNCNRTRGDAGSSRGAQAEGPEQRFQARRVDNIFIPSSVTGGPWGNAEWWLCRDGKARPAEPGTFPLVDGATARVGRLRAYGNAIVPQVAATFVRAVMDYLGV